ncbi:hypothetical protein B9G98_03073 [Wickerhamiella sorbophila]|uniref:Nudix hydrolase domain-containing protein n=1 Tax=Wickerhamiella sorbophila TaxID=45607 RepID=A0A2T0FKD5_9ASCO|nr:hypothetical protein B9G98_03073 [Wickerhamiella sorbophila]PRT55453.1 hypothetical protein B9G98_03073 [Wickerhamiella sorbophila]
MTHTYLDLMRQVDSAKNLEGVYEFRSHDGNKIGKILPFVVAQLKRSAAFEIEEEWKTVRITLESAQERSAALKALCADWRQDKVFRVLEGWRNELYPVYSPSKTIYFVIERSAACLFGLVTYGSHITGYVPAQRPEDFLLWVPRRSYSKPTWPGKLDNTVAGGLGFPAGPWETAIKECQEEAGLPAEYVQPRLKTVGVLTYEFQLEHTVEEETGVYQPEVEYIYDLEMDKDTQPHPEDGEVHEFSLMTTQQVHERLVNGEFKYNCALVMIDFFIRHGIVTPENEQDYIEIVGHCHRKLDYPLR